MLRKALVPNYFNVEKRPTGTAKGPASRRQVTGR